MRKFLITIITLMVMLVTTAGVIYAYSFTVTVNPSSVEIARGNTVTVKFGVSNLDVGQYGIDIITGALEYDKKIFNTVQLSDIVGLNGCNIMGYNESDGKINVSKAGYVNQDTELMQVTFTVKSDATLGKTEIKFKDIIATNDSDDIEGSDTIYQFNVVEATSKKDDDDSNSSGGSNNTGNNGSSTSGGSSNTGNNGSSTSGGSSSTGNNGSSTSGGSSSTGNNGSSTSGGSSSTGNNGSSTSGGSSSTGNNSNTGNKLPSAGKENSMTLIISIVLINSIIAFVGYKSYKIKM